VEGSGWPSETHVDLCPFHVKLIIYDEGSTTAHTVSCLSVAFRVKATAHLLDLTQTEIHHQPSQTISSATQHC
jgi:hypothetical protein